MVYFVCHTRELYPKAYCEELYTEKEFVKKFDMYEGTYFHEVKYPKNKTFKILGRRFSADFPPTETFNIEVIRGYDTVNATIRIRVG